SHQERIASQRRTTSEVPMHRSAPNHTKRSRSPFASTRRRWDDRESSGTSLNVENGDYPSTPRWRDAASADAGEAHAEGLARRARGEGAGSSSEPKYPEDKKDNRNGQVKPEKVSRRRRTMADSDFWAYTDDYYRYYEEDSDSDKEWMAALRRKYRNREQPQSSSGENWEPLPVKEEPEPQQASGSLASTSVGSNGSGYPEEVQEPSLQEEQASLEEGEIPWLRYNENESSSEADNESGHEMMQPGMFVLDGNNNLEDDSSVSEDLEVDWSLFDGFADGLGVAEAISYVDPQFLTYMALEERLAQAMETALAHLESLAVDVEVANPPASKESIDALPEILVTEDHGAVGQEMCCPICCSEYVKGEVATELPCHHYFHKPCVSIWLQKSGTCPVCRCMFPPPL
uniref:RING-type E3 ubiquitin transferase n=1 Tax=Cricetulus griseus TaxID=10029 RepID=A0A8C2LTC3_CRIGR